MKQEKQEVYRSLMLATQLGWVMVAAILAGFLVGYFLDTRFKSHGVLVILFTLLGIVGGGWRVYGLVMKQFDTRSRNGSDGKTRKS